MRTFLLTMMALIMFVSQSAYAATPSPQWVKNLPVAKTSEQMVIVAGVQGSTAWISMHEKINGQWEMIMTTPGFIGKNGLGKTRRQNSDRHFQIRFRARYRARPRLRYSLCPSQPKSLLVGRQKFQIQSACRRARGSSQLQQSCQRAFD